VNLARHILRFGRESYKWKANVKIHLKETLLGLDLFGSGKDINKVAFEHGTRNWGSVKKQEFLVQMSDC
jgi:hypothetical protein